MENILIIHRDPTTAQNLQQRLHQLGFQATIASTPAAAQPLYPRARFDLAFIECSAPEAAPAEFYAQCQLPVAAPLAVLLAPAAPNIPAAAWIQAGFFDLLAHPGLGPELDTVLARASAHLRISKQRQLLGTNPFSDTELLIGQSQSIQNLRQLIRKVARTETTLLIHGETGTGKSVVARELHRQSARAFNPLLVYSCAQSEPHNTENELFGQNTPSAAQPWRSPGGFFPLAHGATVVLDEIAELPGPAQSRLLEFLQSDPQTASPTLSRPNVRLLTTTSRNLEDQCRSQAFNEQLFFRLNIMPILVPSLRERVEDIPLLAESFRQQAVRKYGAEALAISPEAIQALQGYSWPGNVRELRDVIFRAIWRTNRSSVLNADDLSLPRPVTAPVFASLEPTPPLDTLHEIEKKHIFVVLAQCRQNRTHAARMLGISIRTLRNKLREYREAQNTANAASEPGQPLRTVPEPVAAQG